jgi:hypothetical protein
MLIILLNFLLQRALGGADPPCAGVSLDLF